MFIGTYRQKVDDKGRLNFPANFREEIGPKFFVASWLENALIVVTAEKFESVYNKLAEGGMVKNRELRRMLFSKATTAEPDKQGRILLPQNLRDYSGIKADAVIIGAGDYVEIWQPERWEAEEAKMTSDEMAKAMEMLDI